MIKMKKKGKNKMKTVNLYNYEVESIVKTLSDPGSILNTDDSSKKLPIGILWKIDENVERLYAISNRIQKKRAEIEQKYIDDEHSEDVTLDSGEVIRKVKAQYFNEFNSALKELMGIKNEIEISPIEISDLEEYSFVPKDYRSIRFMLNNDKKEEATEKTEIM